MESSTWESDYLNPDIDFHQDFRSSSAPPPATSLLFADDGDSRGDSHYLGNSDFLNNMGQSMESPLDRSEGTKLYDSYRSERNRNPSLNRHAPKTAASDLSLSPPVDRRFLGEFRSQSAAPSLQSLGPPPGLEKSDRVRPQNTMSDSYLGADETNLLLMGQRRAASTGVLGNRPQKSQVRFGSVEGGAVRPAAKTLMDLIKEDVETVSPDRRYRDEYNHQNGDFREDRQRDDRQQMRSQAYNRFQDGDGRYHSGDSRYAIEDGRYPEAHNDMVSNGSDNFEGPMDHMSMRRGGPRQGYETMQPQNARRQMARPQTNQPQMMSRGQRMPYGDNRMQHMDSQDNRMQNMHSQDNRMQNMQRQHERTRQNHPYMQHVDMPSSQYEQQQQMYGSQMQSRVHPQVVPPPGHAIFVNPTPQPYGYMQYQQPGMPEGQQYINILPMQGGGGGQVQALGGALGGAYAFWQPDGQTGGQTLTILNPNGPHGVPLAVATVHEDRSHGSQHTPPHGRSKEKNGGKTRRGGANSGRSRNQGYSTHDSLLGEFKSRKNHRDWTIREINGHVVDFCQDQNGSRFIQQRIEIGDVGEKEIVLQEVLPAVRILRNDVFGNYVVQKLLDFGTPDMLAELYSTFQGEMLELSLQMYGCRVVQKALEKLDESALLNLLSEFHNNVLSCIHDQNGNHVIQKSIQVVSQMSKAALANGDAETAAFFNEKIDFIVHDVLRNVASLSCHPYGCRVFQRILEHCVEPDKSRALDEIMKCHRTLLDDQYGNYVIQHVLQYGRHADREQILHFVLENGLLSLSRQKFASNVVEKLLKYGTDSQRKAVVREMLKIVDETTATMSPNDIGCSVVLLMVRDAYANYVVQTTLDVILESQEKVHLLEELRSHSDELKSYTFAKHIVMKLEA